MVRQAIIDIVDGAVLDTERAERVMASVMDGEATSAQIAALLTALRLRGETVGEVVGFARAMRSHAVPVRTSRVPVIDTCGTGGGGAATINVSTGAALVAAGAGLAVAKHGNRAVTSRCGSADVLAALGVTIELDAAQAGACLDQAGISFLFAPRLHPAMKHAVAPRREIGVRTVFNILGPLTNPAGARRQVIGAPSVALADLMAEALAHLGAERVWVVHGLVGVDELACEGESYVCDVAGGTVTRRRVCPADAGLPQHATADVLGDSAESNAADLLAILRGQRGAKRDFVVLNAAAALVVGGLAGDLAEGARLAAASLDSGAALASLDAWRAASSVVATGQAAPQ
ncbi:MAG: anthranilate phosphoribosyltransferase [Armatimonadetes bacterium]|nr:anthranilate phosphoribosyltransferase [Armatimonadota bacterium]